MYDFVNEKIRTLEHDASQIFMYLDIVYNGNHEIDNLYRVLIEFNIDVIIDSIDELIIQELPISDEYILYMINHS